MKMLKILIKDIGITLLASVFGLLLLCIVYAIPSKLIMKHGVEAVAIFEKEGTYPTFRDDVFVRMHPDSATDLKTLLLNNRITARDNWTDAIMFENALYDGNESILNRTLSNYRYDGEYPVNSFIAYYGYGNITGIEKVTYERYWHGYLVLLKPLLLLVTYRGIRIINIICMLFLTCWLAILILRKIGKTQLFVFLFSLLFFMPFTVPFCMQYCTSTYVMLISTIVLLKMDNLLCNDRLLTYFLLVGIITSYVDFLTFPLVTLGLPLVMLINIDHAEMKGRLAIMKFSLQWAIGYVGMWAMKWIFATILLEKNIILEAIEQILFRSSSQSESGQFKISSFMALGSNLCNYVNVVYVPLVLLAIVLVAVYWRKNNLNVKKVMTEQWRLLVVAAIPFVWYLAFKNHSYSHGSFTFRCLFITVYAGLNFFFGYRDDLETEDR